MKGTLMLVRHSPRPRGGDAPSPRRPLARPLAACALPLSLGACSPSPPARPSARPPAAPSSATAMPARGCPASLDTASLLERHGRQFGTAPALEAMLPRAVRVEFETEGQAGVQEVTVDRTRYRSEWSIGGTYGSQGDDGKGPWSLGGPGVFVRLREGEGVDVVYAAWLERRSYLADFDPKRDEASCEMGRGGGAELTLRYLRPGLGEPALTFDLESAALVRAEASGPDGHRVATHYEAWSAPDGRGVRWPEAATQRSAVSEPVKFRHTRVSVGPSCEGVDKRFSAEGCLLPPAPNLKFEWPSGGVVRVPMRYYLGELSLRVGLNGRQVWALLDSGAGLTSLDATTPAGEAFKPGIEVTGAGASQKVRMGLGEVDTLTVGGLTLRHLPVASVPIPALDGFGDRRPEVIVGYSLFLGAAVRVDYAKGELAFARSAGALVRPGAKALPFRILGDLFAAEANVEGAAGTFQIDTGNSGGFAFWRPWAEAHGLLSGRPTLDFKGKTGAGVAETSSTMLRARSAEFGPIRHDDRIAMVTTPPEPSRLAGLIGNRVLSRCAAVTFDVERRTMWLEPPCDRPSGESNAGWHVEKKGEDPAHPGRPWVLKDVIAGGAAELAGLAAGDRLLSIDGVPVSLDISKVEALVERPAGTKLRVSYARAGKAQSTTLLLRPLLADGPPAKAGPPAPPNAPTPSG